MYCCRAEVSTEEILENGEKWMGEEVMLAFKKYKEGKSQFKVRAVFCYFVLLTESKFVYKVFFQDVVHYGLDELQHQCFNMLSYDDTFHHFNFTLRWRNQAAIRHRRPFLLR